MSGQQPASNHRSLNGVVTKLVGDGATYGFINDEIFFPQTNVTGGPAAVGDQVFAECDYSAHLPIKWNASSVKILQRASGQQLQPPPSSNIVPDQSPSVAVTYQQHRQQRQQRMLEPTMPSDMSKPPFQPNDQPGRLLDPNTHAGEFYNKNDPRQQFAQQQQAQQQDGNIQPFQEIMGPPNLTYTSQPGSAFVQNQFVPPPFINQPAPMLSHAQPQQHLLPNNQMQNQGNQRQNHQNKGGMTGRNNNNSNINNNYNNNQGDKNDRHNRRNMNQRNDGKFDRPRSGDREGSQHNRTSRAHNSRDRSLGRGNKRDDIPSRPSPPSHSSARSSTSVSSDKTKKKHYEVQNIPKIQIMTNMNAYNMKQRCQSSVHVPSDLKDIIVNRHFRLDIKNIPKPLKFTIEKALKEAPTTLSEKSDTETKEPKSSGEDQAVVQEEQTVEGEEQMEVDKSQEMTKKDEKMESKVDPTPPSSKSTIKLNHKYGVKVILLSLPEIEEIYHKVFGSNLDSFNSESKPRTRLDEVIMLLCNKGTNNGHSLIGGKFDPVLDGFIEGAQNEFEAQSGQPDLISTCRRVVLDHIGLDLSSCKSWTLLSTFMYNNKSDYFSPKASVEYSFIYIPHIWSMLSESFDRKLIETESRDVEQVEPKVEASSIEEQVVKSEPNTETNTAPNSTEPSTEAEETSNVTNSGKFLNLDALTDLRVVDLKAELDKRGVDYRGLLKKAELIALLQDIIKMEQNQSSIEPSEAENQLPSERVDSGPPSGQVAYKLEEGEVAPDEASPEDSPVNEKASDEKEGVDESKSTKRKTNDLDETVEEPSDKKRVCTELSAETAKEKRVELISESFVVRAKNEQQQSLSLVSLHDVSQVGRSDQFELSVSSNILKESLIQHLSEYIMTVLVEDSRQGAPSSSSPLHTSNQSSSNASSQETGSDTNNNDGNKATFKNPSSTDQQKATKELPVDRYVNIAFTFFDSAHTGYIYFDDLNKLFNNTGLTISKRALVSLVGDVDKFNYRFLPDLSTKLQATCVYQYPAQFTRLPGSALSDEQGATSSSSMVEYQGVSYDLKKLIEQVRETESMRVKLVERFNYAIEKYDKQTEEIHVLEVSQKSLAKAIKAQNDEICDLKRERDSIKKKFESVRKGIKGTITSLSDLVKEEK